MIPLSRRPVLQSLLVAPLVWTGCQPGEPKTPLAHLHGEKWVHGAYEHYAKSYQQIQADSERQTHDVYRVIAQKGIVALDGLQCREVPFHIRADAQSRRFVIQRNVPERLTFTADMSKADRDTATAAWNKAREHIHTDYDEIHRLDWSLTSLLGQLDRTRSTIDRTREEQFEIVLQIAELSEGPPPFELPYQVSPSDYERVLFLLLERLEDDRHRLERIESAIVSVGFAVRATDANSGSLADNVRKVLLAVVQEGEATSPRPSTFPRESARHDQLVAEGKALYEGIRASPEFAKWQKARTAQQLQQVGALLSVIDSLTGIPASAIYRQVIEIWSGDDDYLSYLQVLARLVPGAGKVSSTLDEAIDTTKKVRAGTDRLRAIASSQNPEEELAGVINVGSRFARSRTNRQIVFYRDRPEVQRVQEALAATDLMRGDLPAIPER